jgi:hypothetical protein
MNFQISAAPGSLAVEKGTMPSWDCFRNNAFLACRPRDCFIQEVTHGKSKSYFAQTSCICLTTGKNASQILVVGSVLVIASGVSFRYFEESERPYIKIQPNTILKNQNLIFLE